MFYIVIIQDCYLFSVFLFWTFFSLLVNCSFFLLQVQNNESFLVWTKHCWDILGLSVYISEVFNTNMSPSWENLWKCISGSVSNFIHPFLFLLSLLHPYRFLEEVKLTKLGANYNHKKLTTKQTNPNSCHSYKKKFPLEQSCMVSVNLGGIFQYPCVTAGFW